MKVAEYTSRDGLGLAELVRKGEVTPAELVEVAFTAIEQVDPQIHAITALLREQAEAAARGAIPAGPFAGVPLLFKEMILMCRGAPIGMGSRLFAGLVAQEDTALMARYREAGLIPIGQTSAPEFGLNVSTEPVAHGATRNPWRLDRIAGGSSGGSAAAVAARMVPIAHGNDGGGSLRIPASCCGVFGLKPTRARLPIGPLTGELLNGLGIEHALTRTVRDSAALLDATAGPAPGARYFAPPPERPYLEEVARPPGRLRIAFTDTPPNGAPVSDACRDALRKTVALCAELGHELVEARPAIDPEHRGRAFNGLFAANQAYLFDVVAPRLGREATPETVEAVCLSLAEKGRRMSAVDMLSAEASMDIVSRSIGEFFTRFDVLLTPTLAHPPLPLGTLDANAPGVDAFEFLDRCFQLSPFCADYNLAGNPAMSVPLHTSPDGLPVGMHFVTRYADEATLFRLAAQLEQAAPWSDRRPAVCAG
jgi:amidase